MSETQKTTAIKSAPVSQPKPTASTAPKSVKDSGKVHIGGGMMRY
jgi:hypothetical protein